MVFFKLSSTIWLNTIRRYFDGQQNDTTISIPYATCEFNRFRSINKDKLFASSGGELSPIEID